MTNSEKLAELYPSYADFFFEHEDELEKVLTNIGFNQHGGICFPENIATMFRFAKVPVDKIQCVIVGMEPYASWTTGEDGSIIPVATGRSFEVGNVANWTDKYKQASLRNIFKSLYYLYSGENDDINTIRNKMNNGEFNVLPPHEWFDAMEGQGVVFLNATLTVEKDKPDSHTFYWEDYMRALVRYIVRKSPNAMWILSGNNAYERFEGAVPLGNIIKVHHPRMASFVTECPFKYVPLNWFGV